MASLLWLSTSPSQVSAVASWRTPVSQPVVRFGFQKTNKYKTNDIVSNRKGVGSTYIEFDNVEVPVANLLGRENCGFEIIMSSKLYPKTLPRSISCHDSVTNRTFY